MNDWKVFVSVLKKVMEHNGYEDNELKVEACDAKNQWTPTDLILREYYNNGGGSANGFLGITEKECIECYYFIREHQNILKSRGYYNKDGYNNFGFPLWKNYVID